MKAGKGGGLSTILRPGHNCGGLESSLDGELDPVTGVEWVGLVCAWGTDGACVSGYLAGIHLFMNRCFRETVRLGYGLAQ